jgi:hypothetical protein
MKGTVPPSSTSLKTASAEWRGISGWESVNQFAKVIIIMEWVME